jgi:hypothetical protein
MTHATSIVLASLITARAAAPLQAQTPPPQPSAPPTAAEAARPSQPAVPSAAAAGKLPPKQRKKMGHAGKKRAHGKRAPKGARNQGTSDEPGPRRRRVTRIRPPARRASKAEPAPRPVSPARRGPARVRKR